MDSWARLSLYESTDLTRGLFQARHGRRLNAGKAAEIASAIAQGREYFSAASDSGLLVRPLLQYYGVLSLCRGLILLLSGNARETSLAKSHGLTPTCWNSLLRTDAPEGMGDLKVAFTKGTFPSLLESTENLDISFTYVGPYPSKTVFRQTPFVGELDGRSVTFDQVLSRIPELRDVYERSCGKRPSCYRAFVFALNEFQQVDIDVFEGHFGLPPVEVLREQLGVPDDVTISLTTRHNFMRPAPHANYRLTPSGGLVSRIEMLPQIDGDRDGTASLIVPFPDGLKISRIGRLFLLSFFLGTLARYWPTTWLAVMQGRRKGDFMMPVVREAMNVIQQRLPELVVDQVEGIEDMRPW